jgi:hypothetical protein
MTTIAYDGRLIACDTQLTAGGVRFTSRKAFDIATDEGRLVVFGCGTWNDIVNAVDAITAGDDPPDGDYTLLSWSKTLGVREYDATDEKWTRVVMDRYAAGSGTSAALAAMVMGADAAKAVAVAALVDAYTSGPTTVFDTKTGRFRRATKGSTP